MENQGPHKLELEQQPSSATAVDLMNVDGGEPIEAPAPPSGGPTVLSGGLLLDIPVQFETEVAAVGGTAKRRRGRPLKSKDEALPPPPPPPREEDVCFVCFDGGNLVLCDRRGCPKAYHLACIKRDESFFQSKAKWNCGWHICSTCYKASHHMCYTCTFSVCKKCVKDADYVSVRGNMGFCGMCMKTIMLLENISHGDKEAEQVDFDDKSSWEYLFKVYWLCLKGKLSLTLDELITAKNPWKEACTVAPKVKPRNDTNRRNHNCRSNNLDKLDSRCNNNSNDCGEMLPKDTKWATEELLEFVALMKNGDTSLLAPFDVQPLLMEYINRNNLRDPRKKSQVICDPMLVKLFGKERVGHIEMLMLLESHFLIEENSSIVTSINGRVAHSVSNSREEDSAWDPMGSGKRQKTRKRKADVKGRAMNPDEYAAIDFHNINLIYLRRNWVETLTDDINEVHKKAVGSIARVRISGNDQKQEKYRLVQVIGTCKAAKGYQIGTRTTDVMLEILNLDKQEVISIDEISDQDFTEDECKRLRLSMKCGLNKALKVGEIMDKAVTFQSLRVKESLEAEILRLNHLRDRASEKGRRQKHRECVEKLELLKSPEEHQRRLQEIPEVHADLSMDPKFVLAVDAQNFKSQENSGLNIKERELVMAQNASATLLGTNVSAYENGSAQFLERLKSPGIQEAIKNEEEANSLWHYQDLTGKIQGPFSLSQLHKWKTSGQLALDLRIWRNYESRDNFVLLVDALDSRYHKSVTRVNGSSSSQEQVQSSDNQQNVSEKKIQSDINLDVHANADSDGNSFFSRNSLASSPSSGSSGCATVLVAGESDGKQIGSLVTGSCVSEADNSLNGRSQVNCPLSSSMISVNQKESPEAPNSVNQKESPGAPPIHAYGKNTDDQSDTDIGSLNQEINFLDLPSSNNPKSIPEIHEAQAAETVQPIASAVLNKGTTGLDRYTATPSQVMGGLQNGKVMAALSEKSAEYVATTQTSENAQVAHSSDWLAIVPDLDESVSDLLAELEAMESMNNGLPSSATSTFQCDDDDKDVQDLTENYQNRGVNHSTNIPKRDSENTAVNPVSRQVQGCSDQTDSVTRGFSHLSSTLEHGSVGRNANVNGLLGSNLGTGLDQLHGCNREFRGRDSGSGLGGESSWWINSPHNQQLTVGNGTNQAHPPKGLRICKFYENGYCKKGAACSFQHP